MINQEAMKLKIKLLNLLEKYFFGFGRLGNNSFILPPFRIINTKRLFIGHNVRIGKYAFINLCVRHNNVIYDPKIEIGNNVSIGHDFFAGCQKSIIIEDNVLISSRVFIVDAMHGYEDIRIPIVEQDLVKCGSTIIERDSFIGANACILPGLRIGRHSVVAAGSVVTKDVPQYSVVAGNPAKVIKRYSKDKSQWERVL